MGQDAGLLLGHRGSGGVPDIQECPICGAAVFGRSEPGIAYRLFVAPSGFRLFGFAFELSRD
jgi:hypothetical protein